MAGPGEAPESTESIDASHTERQPVSTEAIQDIADRQKEAQELSKKGTGNPAEANANLQIELDKAFPGADEKIPVPFNSAEVREPEIKDFSNASNIYLKTENGKVTGATINGEPANPKDLRDTLNNFTNPLPEGLGKFLRNLFAMLTGGSEKDTQAMKDALGKITDNTGFKETLAKYNPKVGETRKGETTLQFAEPAKVIGEKTAKKADGAEKDPKPESVKIEDGKIVLADGAKISQVTEKDGKLYLAIDNKDGSHDVYVVEGAKPAENPASATA